uniref:Uncharacterized protein n=1 Tax=Brassica oleracea var. oleracea TaxID=109376 RepID=A0A0D3A3K6_BRAOL
MHTTMCSMYPNSGNVCLNKTFSCPRFLLTLVRTWLWKPCRFGLWIGQRKLRERRQFP